MRDELINDYIRVDLWAVWAVVDPILPNLEEVIDFIIKALEIINLS